MTTVVFDPVGCLASSVQGRSMSRLLHLCEIGKLVTEIVFAIGEGIAPHKIALNVSASGAFIAVEPQLIHTALQLVIEEVLRDAAAPSVIEVRVVSEPGLQVRCEGRYELTIKGAGHLWERTVQRRADRSDPLKLASQIMQAHGGTIDLQASIHGARYTLAFGTRSPLLSA